MKFKAAVGGHLPKTIVKALNSPEYAEALLLEVAQGELGAKDVLTRPAEYYVQEADPTITRKKPEQQGVEVRLTGVTRNGRTPAAIRNALVQMEHITIDTIRNVRKGILDGEHISVQVFCVIMLDADIHLGSGQYSNVVETEAKKLTV